MAATISIDTPAGVLAAAREHRAAATEPRWSSSGSPWTGRRCTPPSSSTVPRSWTGPRGSWPIAAGGGAAGRGVLRRRVRASRSGCPPTPGSRYLGDAVEVRYRLPRLWDRVVAGRVPVWQARRIAQSTLSLPVDGRGVRRRPRRAGRRQAVLVAQLDRTVEEARVRYDPTRPSTAAVTAAEAPALRHRHPPGLGFDGTVHVEADLDLADALDLDDASARARGGSPTSGPPSPWTCAGRMAAGCSPAASAPSTSRQVPDGRPGGAAVRAPDPRRTRSRPWRTPGPC